MSHDNMDQNHSVRQPKCLESLSLDVKVDIFKAVPDVASLISLVLTSASFYDIFKTFAPQILSAVLSNEISAAIMDDASFTWNSSLLPEQSIAGVLDFLDIYHPHPEITAGQITQPKLAASTLDDALAISKLHSNVRFFTEGFCSSMWSRRPFEVCPFTSKRPDQIHPVSELPNRSCNKVSDTEIIRIMRAFYWFQLHCNLYRKCCHSDDESTISDREEEREHFAINDTVRKTFFNKFYPWEIEQLCSVHEYLNRKLAPAFEDMVEHDVSWTNVVPYDDENGRNDDKELYISKGLDFIRRIIQAETFEARKTIFDRFLFSETQLVELSIGLEITANDTTEISFNLTSPPFLNADLGPYLAWRWAYEGRGGIKRYCAELDLRDEREWGYCFLDQEKVQEWSVFKESWSPLLAIIGITKRDRTKREWDTKSRVSRKIRKQIYDRGGRGWWAPGDWSKITWLDATKFDQVPLELEWIIDEVLASRIWHGKLQYQLSWHGWEEDAGWYDATSLKNAPLKVQIFHAQHPDQPGPLRRLKQ